MRKSVYLMIEPSKNGNKVSDIYDTIMMAAIIASIVPLAFKTQNSWFAWIESVSVLLFVIDYVLRFITADFKLNCGIRSFIRYPFTPMAIIDLISILPSLTILNRGFRLFRLFRLVRMLKVMRTFKFLRYSKSFEIIVSVFKKQKNILSAVCSLAAAYILISALAIYNAEPETFDSFFDAVYWAAMSLTTVGYGDICPVTVLGRLVTMMSSFLGIAVITLPAGVITAGYMREIIKNESSE